MNYFQVNYYRLRNLSQKHLFAIIILIIIIGIFILGFSYFKVVSRKYNCYGIYQNNLLNIKVMQDKIDIFKDNKKLIFNKKEVKYKINNMGEYELIDNKIYQNIYLTIDGDVYDNEVGEVEIYYRKEKLIKFIFELFK